MFSISASAGKELQGVDYRIRLTEGSDSCWAE